MDLLQLVVRRFADSVDVKCSNCYFWKRHTLGEKGDCLRYPHSLDGKVPETHGEDFSCGEFRHVKT